MDDKRKTLINEISDEKIVKKNVKYTKTLKETFSCIV